LTEIVQLRDAAARSERLASLGRLAAGLAHEIRNPLSSISGSVELVRESSALSEDDRNLLGLVLTEADRLNDLVTTMLKVGAPVEATKSVRDLRPVVEDVVQMAQQGLARLTNVSIEFKSPDQPVRASVDGGHI